MRVLSLFALILHRELIHSKEDVDTFYEVRMSRVAVGSTGMSNSNKWSARFPKFCVFYSNSVVLKMCFRQFCYIRRHHSRGELNKSELHGICNYSGIQKT